MSATATATTWRDNGAIRALARGAGTLHRSLYRATGGKLGGSASGVPVALLTTRGRNSGRAHTWPICYLAEGDNFLLVASAGGSPRNPGWYYNLLANPSVTIEIGRQTRAMLAEPLTGSAREERWARIVKEHPVFAGYQRKVTREIPVVLLRPAP